VIHDETGRCRALARALDGWAAREGMRPDDAAAREELRAREGVRWVAVERGYWHAPRRSARTLKLRLDAWAAQAGLVARSESGPDGTLTATLAFPDGRAFAALRSRRQCFAAIVIDDLGFSMATAHRVVALPCKLTCAIIPMTPHARAVAGLAAAHGKEVFIHMPMSSPFKVPDVPEYSLMLRVGMPPEAVRDCFAKAFENIPNAVGVNNHEGSLATEDPALMAEVMAALKPRNVVFLDSGTTENTVAWMAARDGGLRWMRRNVFLDAAPRSPEATEAEFDRLIMLARRRGGALAIGHHQFPTTLAMLERKIPIAQREGVEFVFATALAHAPGEPVAATP